MLESMQQHFIRPQRDQIIALSLLAFSLSIAFLAYTLGLPGDYVLDDFVRFPGINPANASIDELTKETLLNVHGLFGRPLSTFTITLTKATSGNVPEAFKYQNILLHLIAGLTQFWGLAYLLAALLSQQGHISPETSKPKWIPAACIASIWLVHPLFVSTVLYSVQRSAILAAIFVWAAITCYIIARRFLEQDRHIPASVLLFIGVPLFSILGIASKETAALVPLYLLLIMYFTRSRESLNNPASKFWVTANTVLIILPLTLGGIYFLTHSWELLSAYEFRPFSIFERILTQGYLIWWYASLIFLPLLRRMSIYHDGQWIVGTENLPAYVAILSIIMLGALALGASRRAPLIGFGICLFLASHALESTIFPLELLFEHRNYVGASGLLVAAYGILTMIPSKRAIFSKKKGFITAILLPVLVLSTLLAIRAWSWSDGRKLVMLALQEQPNSLRAHVDAANYALRDQMPGQAANILKAATSIDPTNAGPFIHLHTLKCEGNLSDEILQANHHAARTKRITPYAADGFQKIGKLAKNDRCPNITPDEGIAFLMLGLENAKLRPQYRYHLNLWLADLLLFKGSYSKALEYSDRAREQIPEIPLKHQPRALVLDARISFKIGNTDRLLEDLHRLQTMLNHPYLRLSYPDLVEQTSKKMKSISDDVPISR